MGADGDSGGTGALLGNSTASSANPNDQIMITEFEVLALLGDLESFRVERTVSTGDMAKFGQAVCAFANDMAASNLPGYLLIGADDKTGRPAGLKVTDELLRNLAGLTSDGNILPAPAIAVYRVSLGLRPCDVVRLRGTASSRSRLRSEPRASASGSSMAPNLAVSDLGPGSGDIAVVEVQPSDLPPVRFKGQTWIRRGPRKGIANETEESILIERRTAAARTFDAQPCIGASLSDLALDLFTNTYRPLAVDAETIAENHRPIEQQLASLRFFDLTRNYPTYAGLVLFAKDLANWLPNAFVEYVRFCGIRAL